MEMNARYITEKEVSLITGLALSTLRNSRFKRRGIPYYKINRSCKYCYEEVTAYMESRRIKTEEA